MNFPLIFSLLSLAMALAAVWIALFRTSPSLSMRRLSKIEVEMTELTDSLALMHGGLRKLRARINARAWKNTGKPAFEEPDLSTEEGRTVARRELEAELARSGRLHA